MRRRLLSLTVFLFVATTLSADRTLVIERFNAVIDVSPDGSIVVDETIEPRFTGSWNGIFRTIPVEYRTPQGLNYTLRLEVESVTDAAGQNTEIREQPRAALPQAENLGAGRSGRHPYRQAPLPRVQRPAVLRRARRTVLERHG